MSFYNTYRPHRFADVLGQEQVVKMLKDQAKHGKLGHAYLCFGKSGTGKTSVARIIAMVANCLHSQDGEPCGICDDCRLIADGKHWDCVEMDAARFRGIDDIKDMCYKAYFAPVSKKKVFILDEYHQITEAGFNALLKLLEEPPSHVLIVLATTEYSRIPDTVVSRCQLLPFTELTLGQIKTKLAIIAQAENIALDPKHADFIAETSAGNMRKAENLLEQCCFIHADVL